MFRRNVQEVIGMVGSIVVMLLPFYFDITGLLAACCMLVGAWSGGMFSSMLLGNLQPQSLPKTSRYRAGDPVMVLVNEGASQEEIATKVQQKAASMGGTTGKKGDNLYVLVGDEFRLVRLTYQSSYRNEPDSVAPVPAAPAHNQNSFSY